ncbi:YjgN family protein [Luteimonas sp. RD2P54]|uniref:YjgN family protein n=1 Tax=Luteimonas endophytica TaxID=3042023 RepID=A0ABT6JBK5_9GAMM|nr:YjgN family protein [Luteimonas endophytica]MDH5824181.1 YjgN family protein [Luteimonas endophytica]
MLDQTTAPPDGGDSAPAPAPAPEEVRYRPRFDGRAGEFFGIWIVNLLLSIVTLGIYSAWAKVRTERYFYGNTSIAGSAFEYLADPIRILKGRLVAYAVVIALGLSLQFLPVLYFLLLLAVFACMPLIVFMATRFRAHYSAWRGLRFRFVHSGLQAYGPFMGWPVLSAVTLSLLYPLMKRRQHEYLVSGHRFGTSAFRFAADSGPYYVPYVIALVAAVGGMCLLLLAAGAVIALAAATGGAPTGEPPAATALAATSTFLLAYLGMFGVMVYLRVRYANLLWNSTRLGQHRFESTLSARWVMWLYASNLVAVLCTLGLATPWAMIRLARYRAACFAVVVSGGIEDFLAEVDAERGAIGAELSDALDYGVELGI